MVVCVVPSEARLYPGSIEIFRRRRRRRRRQPEVGLKTSISQQWSTGSCTIGLAGMKALAVTKQL